MFSEIQGVFDEVGEVDSERREVLGEFGAGVSSGGERFSVRGDVLVTGAGLTH